MDVSIPLFAKKRDFGVKCIYIGLKTSTDGNIWNKRKQKARG